MQIVKNQILDILSRAIEDNKDNTDLVNKLSAAKKLVTIF